MNQSRKPRLDETGPFRLNQNACLRSNQHELRGFGWRSRRELA
jgi:hypothetical protein